MSKAFGAIAAVLTTAVGSAVVILAQQPRIGNGRVTTQPAASLQQTFKSAVASQADVAWIGYAVPVVDGERSMCCFDSDSRSFGRSGCCGMCGLEPGARTAGSTPAAGQPQAGPIKLEGPDQLVILFRVAGKQVERVRVFSEDCELDAGGRDVVWLTGVRPADSIALLESLVGGQPDRRDRITDGAISAVALHRDPAADDSLERLMAAGRPQEVRSRVPFWLGNSRGKRGLAVLQRVIKEDPSMDVRKKAVFGISQSREANAVDILIDNARNNSDAAIRGEAIFWLAQKAGNKAAAAITERIEQDPDTEVKKRAVFALSQLPRSEGVPLLIQVARTHSNPAVKKQAIFWLGQSKDPRALDYFAEILK
jgi:hypothetical protein